MVTKKKATILTRVRGSKHNVTPKGVSLDMYIYINRRGSGTVRVGGVSAPFSNVGQGIAVVAELMGAKAKAAARLR